MPDGIMPPILLQSRRNKSLSDRDMYTNGKLYFDVKGVGMSKRIFIILVVVLAFTTGCGEGTAGSGIIQLQSGPIRATVEGDMHIFLGIPYAAPPVGDLRWQPPQKVAAWTEVRDSRDFGPSCPQPRQQTGGKYSEDCLYLNVWTPAKKSGQNLPVMVWIHGGAFNFGSASQAEYDGRNLAKKGVVVVTINYRLGPLGFLVHPFLSGESKQETSGNYGLLDQIAALGWVQNNIAAFGGNPEKVTIFGQSAGSRSVNLLMISPLAAGLFHRSIAQSGGPIIGSEYLNPNFNGSVMNVSKMGERLAARLGCDKAPDVPAALRAKSAEEIITAADCSTGVFDYEGLFFAPVFDGRVLPENPLRAFEAGRQHDVPIIVGSTANEGTLYLDGVTDLSVEKYQSFLKARFAGEIPKALDMFPVREATDVASAIDRVLTVGANAEPARLVAQSMERKNIPAYLYQFTRQPGTKLARKLGVHHGVDLAYIFGNMAKSDGYDGTDLELSGNMMAYWVNFAKTGNPNGEGLPVWPAYKSQSDINLEFAGTIRIRTNLYKNECDFISDMLHRYWK